MDIKCPKCNYIIEEDSYDRGYEDGQQSILDIYRRTKSYNEMEHVKATMELDKLINGCRNDCDNCDNLNC